MSPFLLGFVLRYAPDSFFCSDLDPAVNCWAMGIRLSSCGLKRTMGFYYNGHISLLQQL